MGPWACGNLGRLFSFLLNIVALIENVVFHTSCETAYP